MPRIVPATAPTVNAVNARGGGVGCAEHGDGPMSDPDELLARADNESLFIAAVTNGVSAPLSYAEAIATLKQAGRTIEALVAALRAALAAQPQPVTLDYDNGYKQGFRDGLRQQGHDVDRLVAEAVAGPAAPTGDRCAVCDLIPSPRCERPDCPRDIWAAAGSAAPTGDDDE